MRYSAVSQVTRGPSRCLDVPFVQRSCQPSLFHNLILETGGEQKHKDG